MKAGSSDHVGNAPQGTGFFFKRQLFGAEQEETKNSGRVMANVDFYLFFNINLFILIGG